MFWPIRLLKKRLINHISTSKWGVHVQGNLVGGVIGCQVSKFSTAVYCLQVELSFLCLERYRYSIWQRPWLFHCWWDSRSPEERKWFQSSSQLPLGSIMAAPGAPPPQKAACFPPRDEAIICMYITVHITCNNYTATYMYIHRYSRIAICFSCIRGLPRIIAQWVTEVFLLWLIYIQVGWHGADCCHGSSVTLLRVCY